MAHYGLTGLTGTNLTFCDHVSEDLQLLDLEVGVHGLVWLVPLAHDSPGPECVHLLRDRLCCQFLGSLADVQWAEASTVGDTSLLLGIIYQALGLFLKARLLMGLESLEFDG